MGDMGGYERLKSAIDGYFVDGSTALTERSWQQSSVVYASAGRLALELRHIFDRSPLVAGCSSELVEPGAYASRSVAGTPLLLVRQQDRSLRCFLNACRHRGVHVVADGEAGCARRFTCGYHGWTYGDDGALVGLPNPGAFDDLERSTIGLAEVPCAERHGLVFVRRRPGGGPIDLDGFLGPMDAELARAGVSEFVAERRVTFAAEANWKLLMDGFLETYHVRYLHADSLRDVVWSDRSTYDRFGPHGRLAVPRRNYDPTSHAGPEDLLAQLSMARRLFPNTTVTWFADHFELYQIEPDPVRPDRSRVHLTLLVPPDEAHRTAKWDTNARLAAAVITGEDFAVAASTQRTLNLGAAPPTFHYGKNEPGVQHFHEAVVEALAAASSRAPQ